MSDSGRLRRRREFDRREQAMPAEINNSRG